MPGNRIRHPWLAAAVTPAVAVPGAAFAYDQDSAIRACEKRLRDEYKLSDFRHPSAEALPGGGHKYNVKGMTKIDDRQYPFGCERHADGYDSRFEPSFKRGYEAGWKANR